MFVRSRRGACHTMERNLGQETAWRDPTDGTTLLCHKDLKSTQLNKDPTDGTTLHCYATKILTRSHRWNHTTQLNKDLNTIPQIEPHCYATKISSLHNSTKISTRSHSALLCFTTRQRSQHNPRDRDKPASTMPNNSTPLIIVLRDLHKTIYV